MPHSFFEFLGGDGAPPHIDLLLIIKNKTFHRWRFNHKLHSSSLLSSLRRVLFSKFSLTSIIIMKFSAAAIFLLATPSSTASAFVAPSSTTRRTAASSELYATTTTATTSGVERNPNFAKLAGGYLFPEIGRRRNEYIAQNPDMASRIISLGIGDTTLPIPTHILQGLVQGASRLGTKDGYSGYGAEQGQSDLREKIATKLYKGIIQADEVFVSDGAKCDIMRLQQMFGSQVTSAVQDPSYPVYVDTSVMMGQTGNLNESSRQYNGIVYMPCSAENGFFPDYASLPRADVVYLCSPKYV
jgi:LL-diaminopimelate aminotransferase